MLSDLRHPAACRNLRGLPRVVVKAFPHPLPHRPGPGYGDLAAGRVAWSETMPQQDMETFRSERVAWSETMPQRRGKALSAAEDVRPPVCPPKPRRGERQQPRATPWENGMSPSQALKGRKKEVMRAALNNRPERILHAPLQGSEKKMFLVPRALPWAITRCAFSA